MVSRRKDTAEESSEEAQGARSPAPVRRRRTSPAPPPSPAPVPLAREVVTALEKVRVHLDAAMMRFTERVGGELDRVRSQIAADPDLSAKVLVQVKERLEEVRLKPQRGRVKDFARLEDLADDLADLIPPRVGM